MSLIANITNISRCSLHDGPGLRTVVYFKGCPLHCMWCHNPETIAFQKEIMFRPEKCIYCGKCIEICPGSYRIKDGKIDFLRNNCKGCGKCAEECPSTAISIAGNTMTVDEAFAEIAKDAPYFSESGGGVTFSGGECLMQADFVVSLAKKCKDANISTAIESAFFVPYANVEAILPFMDYIFADLKIPDAQLHQKYTGAPNTLIIENIRKISHIHKHITIRIPLIPGVNDSEESMAAFSRIINTFGDGIVGVELLKYNYMAGSKYRLVGKAYTDFGNASQPDKHIEALCRVLKEHLSREVNVFFVK